MNIIPAIDLRGGRVVRLAQGDFTQQRQFDHDPIVLAENYADAGAKWLHVVDLDGARAGAPAQTRTIAAMCVFGARIQAGGGVRTRADAQSLFDAGIARVVVGSVAVGDPDTFAVWLDTFGAERLCLALDLRQDASGNWHPATDAWQNDSDAEFAALLDYFDFAGLRHVLTTDIGRDGMRGGPNLALYRELVARWPTLAWIASGGVRNADDVTALRETGVVACVAGSALLDGTLALTEIAACSRAD